nr:hypothetical protein [Tanacetum cinerariifolium]
AAGYGGAQNRVENANPGQARQIKCYNCNGIGHIARNCTQPKHPQNSDYFKDKMLLMPAQENGVALDEEQLLFLVDDYGAFDSNVDEAPTTQTMFLANLSSADPVCDETGLSYDSDILFKNTVVDNSLTAELATYKKQVELYERRARFELMEREQKIDEQLRIVITDRKFKEETLKKELHSVKLQLASTINHNKLMVEDRLYKQDQSLQTVHMLCRPKPYYNELNKVASGYKNPLCLTHAKQVQPALYNGYEIIKNNHVPAIVHNTEDTLEIAEITRRKMTDKMKDPECVKHKVKITPHDYLKDNFLETFTSQQIFWSQDLIKIRSSQRAYHSLKTNQSVDGHSKGSTKEIKEMKDVFKELEAEVDQNVVDRKHDEIERKNLLIENDNLITECLSKEVFYVATNSELNVYRFTEMHVAHIIVEARCLELEAELSNLRDKIHNDNHELVNRFSNLKDHVKPTVLALGVNSCTDASRSKPKSNTKKNRISPAKGVNKMKVEEYPKTNKSHLRTMNRVDSSSLSKHTLSKFGNLSTLGKYGNPQEKYLPVLVINGDPQAEYSH